MILAGDSNEILRISEKFNGRSINFNRSNKFLDCINYCNFLDFGFKGSRYMWPNKRLYGNTILERLGINNKHWQEIAPSVLTFCHTIFTQGYIPAAINNTYLCLIPKQHNAA